MGEINENENELSGGLKTFFPTLHGFNSGKAFLKELVGNISSAVNFFSTDREFFAEGVTSFFDVNTETWNGKPNGIHNHVNTRAELKSYDRELYNLVKEVFPCQNKFLDRCSALRGVGVRYEKSAIDFFCQNAF